MPDHLVQPTEGESNKQREPHLQICILLSVGPCGGRSSGGGLGERRASGARAAAPGSAAQARRGSFGSPNSGAPEPLVLKSQLAMAEITNNMAGCSKGKGW